MTDGLRLSALLGLAGLATGVAAVEPPPHPGMASDARCAVWTRELGFAAALARHDTTAFAGFLHADAVFGVGHQPTRGRDAIVADWMPLIEGKALELRWYPERVSVGGDGRTAYSSGPALYRNPKDGSHRLGRFGSVWQQDRDGQWRVIFDDGVRPLPVDEAGVKAFEAGRRDACPAA
ncbi:YybH family protein [Pseudoxanthomonas sp. 22568]|uniref:YybH family protein n=1 Tax=Pseudoxanthomonas sp. 22568 TaxID=3453945 RepID=UPI003F83AF9D